MEETPSQVAIDAPIWRTLFGCIAELPPEHMQRVFGISGMKALHMQILSKEYVQEAQYREDERLMREARAKQVGGPWLPKGEVEDGIRQD